MSTPRPASPFWRNRLLQPGRDFAFRSTRWNANATDLQDDRVLRVYCWNAANQVTTASSTAPIPDQDNAWHQVGFVYQGGATDGTIKFYFDGQQLGNPVTLAGIPAIARDAVALDVH